MPAICIHCDGQSTIGRAQSHIYNGKSRHIRQKHNTVRQLISNGIMTIEYIRSKENIADPLTKGLTKVQVSKSSRGMSLKSLCTKESPEWQPNLADWRSQDLGSKGQPNFV